MSFAMQHNSEVRELLVPASARGFRTATVRMCLMYWPPAESSLKLCGVLKIFVQVFSVSGAPACV
jgi:hypothetical protein